MRLLAALLLLTSCAFAAPAFVQSQGANSGGTPVSNPNTPSITPSAGNMLVVIAAINGSDMTTFSCTSAHGTWTNIGLTLATGTDASAGVAYLLNAASVAGTVTCTFNGSAHTVAIVVAEYSGVTSFDLTASSGATSGTTAANCGATSRTNFDSELVVGLLAFTSGTGTVSGVAPATFRAQNSDNNGTTATAAVLDYNSSGFAPQNLTATLSGSFKYQCVSTTFAAAGANPYVTRRPAAITAQ